MITVVNRRSGTHLGSVYAGRPGVFGNPFTVEEYGRGVACDKFDEWFYSGHPLAAAMQAKALKLPENTRLECWCVPDRCHAQTIANFVNQELGYK